MEKNMTGEPNPAVERMRASRSGQSLFLAQWRLARTAHRRRSACARCVGIASSSTAIEFHAPCFRCAI